MVHIWKKVQFFAKKKAVNFQQIESLNRIEILYISVENLIVKLLSKFQSDPCNHVEVISSLRLKKAVSRKTRLKFKVTDRAQRDLSKIFGRAF